MELSRKESLNPDFVHRLSRIQTAQMCRFCLNGSDSSSLINILDNDHVQMLMAECYHGCLGTLNGNASRFVCTVCYQRLEQSYEFLLMASQVQALVDTYTFHDGSWPQESSLKKPSNNNNNNTRKGEKRVASSDEESAQSKKVRFAESDDDDDERLSETSSKVRERCPTPGPEVAPDASETSLDTTLSGEIPRTELVQISESSSLGSDSSPTVSDVNRRRTRMQTAKARSTLGEDGSKELSMVHSLCKRIEAIGVGKVGRVVSREKSKK